MDINKVTPLYQYRIFCDYCIKCVISGSELGCHIKAKKEGYTIKDAGHDGTYNLCPDCTEGIT